MANFETVLPALREGKKIRRDTWFVSSKPYWWQMRDGFIVDSNGNKINGIDYDDLLADNWEVVDEPECDHSGGSFDTHQLGPYFYCNKCNELLFILKPTKEPECICKFDFKDLENNKPGFSVGRKSDPDCPVHEKKPECDHATSTIFTDKNGRVFCGKCNKECTCHALIIQRNCPIHGEKPEPECNCWKIPSHCPIHHKEPECTCLIDYMPDYIARKPNKDCPKHGTRHRKIEPIPENRFGFEEIKDKLNQLIEAWNRDRE